MSDFANSFKDASYDSIDKGVEAKLGLPDGLLSSIRLNGEKSNNNQVSSANARTPYQIIPKTRIAALKAYKIDPYLSPENAAEVAGNLLKDSLKRNNGDVANAVAEYHGGTDRKNWGDITKAYVSRVVYPLVSTAQAQDQQTIDNQDNAYSLDNKPAISSAASKAADEWIKNNPIQLPVHNTTDTPKPAPVANIPLDTSTKKISNELSKAADEWSAKNPVKDQQEQPSTIAKIKDFFTGDLRKTKDTESHPDWATMPELNQMSFASAKTGLGTLVAPPKEIAAIVQHNFPEAKVRQDEKGNFLVTSPSDGKEYAIKPGFQVSDIPRALGGILAFTPAGRAESLAGMSAGSAATQAGIEATQSATGGEFNTGDVAVAGVLPPIFHGLGKLLNVGGEHVANAIKSLLPDVKPIITQAPADVAAAAEQAKPAIQATTEAPLTNPVTNPLVETTQAKPHLNISQADEATAAADDALAAQKQAAYDAQTIEPLVDTPSATPTLTEDELKKLAKDSAIGLTGKKTAQEKLAQQASIDEEVNSAANDLGFNLEPDQKTNNDQFRKLIGLTRSQAGSDAEARGIASVEESANKADEIMSKLGSVTNGNDKADISLASEKVRSSLASTRSDLDNKAKSLYDSVDAAVPNNMVVDLPNSTKVVNETLTGLRGKVESLNPAESRLFKIVTAPETSYLELTRERQAIGKALAGKESPYGSTDERLLKRLYGAMAQDQNQAVIKAGGLNGEALSAKFKLANQLTAKRKALEKRIVNAFGKDNDGSIVPSLRNSIAAGSKGDVAGLVKVLKVIPTDLHKEAIATSIQTLATKNGHFSFNAYANLYRGLRQNTEVYKVLTKSLGKDSHDVMQKLYHVSNGIAKAQAAVLHTGKANQSFMGADNLINNILHEAKTSGAKIGAGLVADAAGGGGIGVGAALMNIIMNSKTPVAKAVGDVLTSPDFKTLVEEAATKSTVNPRIVKKLAYSKQFANFMKNINQPMSVSEREKWIIQSLQAENNGVQK